MLMNRECNATFKYLYTNSFAKGLGHLCDKALDKIKACLQTYAMSQSLCKRT